MHYNTSRIAMQINQIIRRLTDCSEEKIQNNWDMNCC